jgi:hypothetical protein
LIFYSAFCIKVRNTKNIMPEEITNTADEGGEAGNSNEAGASETIDSDQNTAQKNEGGANEENGDAGNGDQDDKGDQGGQDDDDSSKDDDDSSKDDDAEPTVRGRKTAKDYIIERKQKQIDALSAKEKDDANSDGADDDAGADDDDGITDEDKNLIDSRVNKAIEPLLDQNQKQEDDTEVKDFLGKPENKHFKPYEVKVRRFMDHPSRKNVPVSAIFYEVAGPDLLKMGAKMASEADQEADNAAAGGGSPRSNGGEAGPDWNKMGPDDFEKEKSQIMTGQ